MFVFEGPTLLVFVSVTDVEQYLETNDVRVGAFPIGNHSDGQAFDALPRLDNTQLVRTAQSAFQTLPAARCTPVAVTSKKRPVQTVARSPEGSRPEEGARHVWNIKTVDHLGCHFYGRPPDGSGW